MDEVVTCSRLRAKISATCCASRCAARIPSGGGRGAPKFHPCGKCRQGAAVLARLVAAGWTPPPDTLPAEVRDPAQRRARLRWQRSFPDGPEHEQSNDPLDVAARLTPDDRGAEADLAGLA